MIDTMTMAEDLINNPEFVKLVSLEVPAKNLVNYAPDRSIRWIQDVSKKIRDGEYAPFDIHVSPNTIINDQLQGMIDLLDKCHGEPIEVKPLTQPEKRFKVPRLNLPTRTDWWKLDGDFALCSDLHIPFYSASMLERLMDKSYKHGLDKLVIIGDVMDMNSMHHRRGTQYQRRLQDDLECAKPVLKSLLECYQDIYIVMGNHDDWLNTAMRNQVDSKFMFESFFHQFSPRVKWSNYGHCDIYSGGVKWKAIHGTSFSDVNPLGPVKRYASQFLCNIVSGHQHRVAEGYDPSGQFQCVVLGGCYDADKMVYLHNQPAPCGNPKRSVALLKDGKLLHIKE